jgi:hypothetical protein
VLKEGEQTGNHAKSDLRLTELGIVSRDDNVTHHGQLTAPAQSIACDSSDGLTSMNEITRRTGDRPVCEFEQQQSSPRTCSGRRSEGKFSVTFL